MDLLDNTLFDIPMILWIVALAILIGVFAVTWILRSIFLKRYKRLSASGIQDLNLFIAGEIGRTSIIFLMVLSFYVASLVLPFEVRFRIFINLVMEITLLVQVGIWGMGIINYLIDRKARASIEDDPSLVTTLVAMQKIAQFVVWTVIILIVLENLPGIEITSLIAGLGITGIAVALAVQNILGDLFSSLSIVLDKPFVLGDSITVDQFAGTVEKIGMKSTRVRSFQGEELIFSNSDLLSSRIQNFKRMQRRRTILNLHVSSDTPAEKLKQIPEMIAEIIRGQQQVTFDRAHLFDIGGAGISYEVVYFIETQDYTVYMDRRQVINLAILNRFQEESIQFATPSQTVYIGNPGV